MPRTGAIDAVHLVGIRPTGRAVREVSGGRPEDWPPTSRRGGPTSPLITHADTWSHKGVEYDAVVVDSAGMDAAELYLAASRAAHELVVLR